MIQYDTEGFPYIHTRSVILTEKNKDLYKGVDILFADGKTRTIKPLTIRQLRKFMKVVSEMRTTEDQLSDEDIDKMVQASAIALQKVDPELSEDLDALEDILDLRSFNLIMGAAMGSDPNS